MAFAIENVEAFLAPYLTKERKAGFLESLSAFPDVKPLYWTTADPDPLQGDCWTEIPVINIETGQRRSIKAVLISNSCDVSGQNARALPARLNFAPIISVDRYREALLRAELDARRVESHLSDVRAQRVSSLLFLPETAGLDGESIAVLEDVHTIPTSMFASLDKKSRVFSLSDLGFWLFLFKLSYHFCRLQENVDRTPQPA